MIMVWKFSQSRLSAEEWKLKGQFGAFFLNTKVCEIFHKALASWGASRMICLSEKEWSKSFPREF